MWFMFLCLYVPVCVCAFVCVFSGFVCVCELFKELILLFLDHLHYTSLERGIIQRTLNGK